MMKVRPVLLLAGTALAIGCNQEPETPRERAEQAQEELEKAREDAAEIVAEAEEDAVETVADARDEAEKDLQDAKRKATEKVEDAEQDLEEQLDQLTDPSFAEEDPPVIREEPVPPGEVESTEQPKIRVEIEGDRDGVD